MNKRVMLISGHRPDELRVAVVADGVLDDYRVAVAEAGLSRGNIYRGIVEGLQSGLNAAFLDVGQERNAFLAAHDVVAQAAHRQPSSGQRQSRIDTLLERGKPVLVQVTKDASGGKGAAVTTNVSIAGRYLVLLPFEETRGISRKVEDEATRRELRQLADKLDLPKGFGFIIRTNALGQNKTTLNRDLGALVRLWKRIRQEWEQGKGPRLLYSDQDLVIQALRDSLDSTIEEVLVDDDAVLKRSQEYMRAFMPRARTKLSLYGERMPLFSRYNLEPQIESIYSRTVLLPSGGSIVIDGTEALTAIDVNSGKTRTAGSHDETIFRTDLEAVAEVARQLRLRDIGGLVVVDLIDMRSSKQQREVEKALREAMKADRARHAVGRISPNGLLEINRQRISQALQLRTHRDCPTCSGGGIIPSPDFVSLSLLRRIETRAAAGNLKKARISLHPELADALQNNRRHDLASLESEFDIRIEIVAATSLHRSEEQVVWTEREEGDLRPPLPPSPVVQAADLAAETGGAGKREMPGPDVAVSSAEHKVTVGPADETGSERRPRKRRRKKKKAASEAAGTGEEASGAEGVAVPVAGEPEPNAAAAPPEVEPARAGEVERDGEQKRPRRKRRGSRKKKDPGVASPEAEKEPESERTAGSGESALGDGEVNPAVGEPAPAIGAVKGRRSRVKKREPRGAGVEKQEQPLELEAASGSADTTGAVEVETDDGQPNLQPAAAKKRRRRRKKKPVGESEPAG